MTNLSRPRQLLASLLIVTLGGCAQFAWVKPGAGQADFGRDNYTCLQSSMTLAPPVAGTSVFWNNGGGSSVYRDHKAYDTWDHGGGEVVTTDVNAGNRNDLVNACLQSKGWQWVEIKQP